MNAASPGVISLFLQNGFYPTREAYLAALADAMRDEYRRIVDAGLDLQLDCPDLALSRHMLFTDLTDEEFVKVAETHVEALNHALDGLPADRVRVHICWGNYEGPHVCDIDMAKVFPVLMRVRARYLLFETANPRHGHEWTVFRDRARRDPRRQGSSSPASSTPRRTSSSTPSSSPSGCAASPTIVGRDRVIAGSDCGFGTFAGFGAVDPEIAWAKLATLAEGAAARMTPLVLLPGMMCDARLFGPQIAALSGRRPVHLAPIGGHDSMAALAARVLARRPAALRPRRPLHGRHRRDGGAAPGARPRRAARPPRHQPAAPRPPEVAPAASRRSPRRAPAASRASCATR